MQQKDVGIRQGIMAFFLVLAVFLLCIPGYLLAVPMYINYQGVVSDNGVVFNGSKNITFRFFDSEKPGAGNNILGRDIVCYGVSIVDGVFNAEIGPFNSADLSKMASENNLWAEVEINGEKFRQRFASAAFAFRSESAKKADISASVDDNAITSLKVRDGEIKSTDLAPDALAAGNISNIKTTENITLNSGKKLYLDGGNSTYLAESAPGQIGFVSGDKQIANISKTNGLAVASEEVVRVNGSQWTKIASLNTIQTGLFLVTISRVEDGANSASFILLVLNSYYATEVSVVSRVNLKNIGAAVDAEFKGEHDGAGRNSRIMMRQLTWEWPVNVNIARISLVN